jgi:hypothetical protein
VFGRVRTCSELSSESCSLGYCEVVGGIGRSAELCSELFSGRSQLSSELFSLGYCEVVGGIGRLAELSSELFSVGFVRVRTCSEVFGVEFGVVFAWLLPGFRRYSRVGGVEFGVVFDGLRTCSDVFGGVRS